MDDALVIGGSRFVGRHLVEHLLDRGYGVTVFNRGKHDDPFADDDRVAHHRGDRTEDGELRLAAREVDPDAVFDCVAYYPRDVRVATDVFADVDAYVYVSSGAAYGAEETPKRESDTPLHECTDEQATDDSWDTYGNRKAGADREVFRAADDGVRAMAVRPPVIYGPHDYTERFDYWVDRVDGHDRVLVPGDGTNLRHLAYVGDVASALRTVAEAGTAGEAYNVGDRHLPVLDEWVDLVADACGVDVETVHAGPRELAAADLALADFPLYRSYPHVLDTNKLGSLGWTATPHDETVPATVEAVRERGFAGERGPDREAEERVLSLLDTI